MKKIIILVVSMLFLSSCMDSNDYIQDVYVNIEISVNQPEYSDLDAIGNSIFITGGVRGIIIYHSNVNDYRAFDRNCSFEPSTQCAQIDSINSTIASCNCCSSKFLIFGKLGTIFGYSLFFGRGSLLSECFSFLYPLILLS